MAVLLLSFVTTAYSKFYKSTGTNTQTPQSFGDPSKKAVTLLCNKFFVFLMTLFFHQKYNPLRNTYILFEILRDFKFSKDF